MKKIIYILCIFFGISLFTYKLMAKACKCEVYDCSSCESSDGLEFYTSKCKETDKLMSCSKPKCVKLDPAPDFCLSKKNKIIRPLVSTTLVEEEKALDEIQVEIGLVQRLSGEAWVRESLNRKKIIKLGYKVYESDIIFTGKTSKLQIVFKDKNLLNMTSETEVVLSEYRMSQKTSKRKALFKLLRGKIRTKVKNKYKGNLSSHFRIKTSSAVAGVRGTDFVVTYDDRDKEITKVQTLSGEVKLGEQGSNEGLNIKAGHYASFVAVKTEAFNQKEVNEFVKRGYLTPVYRMTKKDLRNVDWETDFKLKNQSLRILASEDSETDKICAKPDAKLNMCSWTCENNPKSSKTCRTDLKGVRCLRRRCNANGQWADDSRLPASGGVNCPKHGVHVAPCDY